MEESNKLIAEFMQKGSQGFGLYDFDGCHYRLDELKYHTSWDWLMPVVIKCFEVGEQTNDDLNFKLNDALLETNIDSLYKAVVEFINQNN